MIGFAAFLEAIGRPSPYPWQERLARQCAQDEPPAIIAVPTGAGKTTTVDALVWALACQAQRPAGERTVGVRIVWAIDRRILVDEVHEHASRLAARLADAMADQADPLHEMAWTLQRLSGEGAPPLVATRWRGGIEMVRELHGPLQPQIITSTVGQIGSRLLFRGYGVSERSQALEAGLAACDTTICLDEAHLARPFRETVQGIRAARQRRGGYLGLPRLRVITLTATPDPDEPGDVLKLGEDDRGVPSLRTRLDGVKRAVLVEPEGSTDRERVAALVAATLEHVRAGADPVACVVNSVGRAREVRRALEAALAKEKEQVACELLIGPQRPADRSGFMREHREKLFGGEQNGPRLVCVATQTFEVGLDADVEAMVTESASCSALIQRFGRLNRRGDRVGRATVVRDEGSWLYGDDEKLAWEWLCERVDDDGTVDVSVAALSRDPQPPPPAHRIRAPLLTDEVVESLAHTSRNVGAWQEIDVEVYWRGAEVAPGADVAVCWRVDLRPELTGPEADGYRELLLTLVPPQRDELLTLTVNAARALLSARYPGGKPSVAGRRLADADADVEAQTAASRPPGYATDLSDLPFVVLRGSDVLRGTLTHEAGAVDPGGIRAGDVVVLPTARGSVEPFPRTDVAGDVQNVDELVPIRLTPEALGAALREPLSERQWGKVVSACRRTDRLLERPGDGSLAREHLGALLAKLRSELPGHAALASLDERSLDAAGCHLELRRLGPADAAGVPEFDPGDDEIDTPVDDGDEGDDAEVVDDAEESLGQDGAPATLVGQRALGIEAAWVLVPTPDRRRDWHDRTLVNDGQPPTLDAHASAVRDQLASYLSVIGLSEPLSEALLIAARAHDHGKADHRVQAFFRRGVRTIGGEPIAKSEFGTRNPRLERIARYLSGRPRGLRHEVASVAVLEEAIANGGLALADGVDRDLVLHLVGTHHGLGRPFPPVPVGGAAPRRFAVRAAGIEGTALGDGNDGWSEGAWLERFWTVNACYGAWDVAYLEALLMLADRVVSARGE